jgi:hypothetical protein
MLAHVLIPVEPTRHLPGKFGYCVAQFYNTIEPTISEFHYELFALGESVADAFNKTAQHYQQIDPGGFVMARFYVQKSDMILVTIALQDVVNSTLWEMTCYTIMLRRLARAICEKCGIAPAGA